MISPPVIPTRLGPYRLDERIAAGQQAEVFRGFDERLERPIAVKRLLSGDARERRRFLREARAVARLNHPAIVDVFDIVEGETGDWIVMEFVDGQTLKSWLAEGPLGLAAGTAIFRDVAAGLSEAHEGGVLHRDLKAENIMVTREGGRGRILDFGMARGLDRDLSESLVTASDSTVGTPHAMSPEQVMGLELDARSDLFSLGTLLYEAFTGEHPFLVTGEAETAQRVCVYEPPLPRELRPGLPEGLGELISQLLTKDPETRPESATEVEKRLRSWDTEAS